MRFPGTLPDDAFSTPDCVIRIIGQPFSEKESHGSVLRDPPRDPHRSNDCQANQRGSMKIYQGDNLNFLFRHTCHLQVVP